MFPAPLRSIILKEAFGSPSIITLPSSFFANMTIKEGSARVNLPEGVFYNPVQEFNRDVTISVLKRYLKIHLQEFIEKGENKSAGNPEPTTYQGLSVLEALAASGLRSVRFANEVPLLKKVISNDMDPAATKLIEENAKINHVEEIVKPSCANAVTLMLELASKDKYVFENSSLISIFLNHKSDH